MRRRTCLMGSAFALAFAAPAQAAPVDLGVGSGASAGSACALASAAPAQAAPVDLGGGSEPSAVIDSAGTAHIVYDSSGGQTYCRLPRNATACDVLTALPLDQHDGRVKIFRRAADGFLVIAQASTAENPAGGYGGTWVRVSTDNGATWLAPGLIGIGLRRLARFPLPQRRGVGLSR